MCLVTYIAQLLKYILFIQTGKYFIAKDNKNNKKHSILTILPSTC